MGHHRGRLTETPPPDGDGEFMSLLFSNSDCSDGATGGGGRTEKIKSSMKEVDLLCMYNGGDNTDAVRAVSTQLRKRVKAI